MREPEVEARVRRYLAAKGYTVVDRTERTGADIVAEKQGQKLAVEVKGDRPGHQSSPGTINVDVMTLLGQVVLRKGEGLADDYAIAIRPVHRRLVEKVLPVLRGLRVAVLLVDDDHILDIP
jgi:hypothetical protein